MTVCPSTDQLLNLLEAVEGRPITVHVSRAHERRLQANLSRLNEENPDDPVNPNEDAELAIALIATSDRGLYMGESDEGVWTDLAGREHPLPRTVRCPIRLRLRFAVRAALRAWRST